MTKDRIGRVSLGLVIRPAAPQQDVVLIRRKAARLDAVGRHLDQRRQQQAAVGQGLEMVVVFERYGTGDRPVVEVDHQAPSRILQLPGGDRTAGELRETVRGVEDPRTLERRTDDTHRKVVPTLHGFDLDPVGRGYVKSVVARPATPRIQVIRGVALERQADTAE